MKSRNEKYWVVIIFILIIFLFFNSRHTLSNSAYSSKEEMEYYEGYLKQVKKCSNDCIEFSKGLWPADSDTFKSLKAVDLEYDVCQYRCLERGWWMKHDRKKFKYDGTIHIISNHWKSSLVQ